MCLQNSLLFCAYSIQEDEILLYDISDIFPQSNSSLQTRIHFFEQYIGLRYTCILVEIICLGILKKQGIKSQ